MSRFYMLTSFALVAELRYWQLEALGVHGVLMLATAICDEGPEVCKAIERLLCSKHLQTRYPMLGSKGLSVEI